MKNNTNKNGLAYYMFLLIFGIMGIGLLFFSVNLTINQINFINSATKSTGQVIELKENRNSDGSTYAPVIKYIDDGVEKTFVSQTSSNPPAYRVGEEVKILISNDGLESQIDSFFSLWFGPIISFVFGIIFTIILISIITYSFKKRKEQKMLDSFGTKIKANQLVVEEEVSSGKGRNHVYFYIQAQWLNPRDNKVYIFYSDYLDYNPKELLPKDVEVTIILENPNIYRMDMSWLPQSGNK